MLEILPLRERPGTMQQLARWHYMQWGGKVDKRMERFQGQLEPGRVPQTFVAVEGTTLLGSASLVSADLDSHDHLSPWLASVDEFFAPRGGRGKMNGIKRVLATYTTRDSDRRYFTTGDYQIKFGLGDASINEKLSR